MIKEMSGGMVNEFMPNMEGFDEERYCICNKEWKGELMIECDRCEKWFHGDCIGYHQIGEIKLNQMEIYCFKCKENLRKEFGEEAIQEQKEDVKNLPTFKYTLRKDLESIFAENQKYFKKKRDERQAEEKKRLKNANQLIQKKTVKEDPLKSLIIAMAGQQDFQGMTSFFSNDLKKFNMRHYQYLCKYLKEN